MDKRFDMALGFTYAAMVIVSEKNLLVFRELLKELNVDEKRIRNMRIQDDDLQAALRGLAQLKRMREMLDRIQKKRNMKQKQ